MQIQSSRRPNEVKIHRKSERLFSYNDVPNHEFTIDEFEQFAIARVNALKWIEKQKALGNPLSNTVKTKITKTIDDVLKENDLMSKKNDSLSHYICRMGYCQTEDRRRWFISQELSLFEERYKHASMSDKQRIIRELSASSSTSNDTNNNNQSSDDSSSSPSDGIYETFDKSRIISSDLNGKSPILQFDASFTISQESYVLPYHKVPFTHVLSLVSKKLVYLRDGYAYVPNNLFSTIIIGKFRSHLSKGLTHASKALQSLHNDPIAMSQAQRVIHIIDGLHKINSAPSYKQVGKSGVFRAKDITNNLVDKHFPLCMQNSYYALQRDGHLKHGARMTFGLFLKGVGVPYTEGHSFFKSSFTTMGSEKFEKTHRYTFRHLYGLEGIRRNYTAFGCNKLISTQPNSGDHHGCPFKLFDQNNLKRLFKSKSNMNNDDINNILNFVNNNHYQLACRKYFEIQHKLKFIQNKKDKENNINNGINNMNMNNNNNNNNNNIDFLHGATSIEDIESLWSHPNEYFDNSYKVYHPNVAGRKYSRSRMMNNNNYNNNNNGNDTNVMTQDNNGNNGNNDNDIELPTN